MHLIQKKCVGKYKSYTFPYSNMRIKRHTIQKVQASHSTVGNVLIEISERSSSDKTTDILETYCQKI